jgi:fructokinase
VLLGVETGGTTIRVAAAERPAEPATVACLPTSSPDETLPLLRSELRAFAEGQTVDAVGVAAFGPIDLDPGSATYGRIGASPKVDWRGIDLLGTVRQAVEAPAVVDTDVNAAALAEQQWGAGRGHADVCYVTIGTGVGVGAVVQGHLLHGTAHPELGHLLVRRHPDDSFSGVCPFHADCLEGLASGPALAARWGRPADALGDLTDDARRLEAYYLAQLVVTLAYALAPGVVVLGGGVAALPGLLDAVSVDARALQRGALGERHPLQAGADFLVASGLEGRAGIVGALTLASRVVPW